MFCFSEIGEGWLVEVYLKLLSSRLKVFNNASNIGVEMEIKLVKNITLGSSGLCSYQPVRGRKAENSYGQVAVTQGSLDGACGPYALMAALLILGVPFDRVVELWATSHDGRTMFAKAMAQHKSLMPNGTHIDNLRDIYKSLSSSKHNSFKGFSRLRDYSFEHRDSRGAAVVSDVMKHVRDKGLPAILGLDWQGGSGGHWVTVVGYQTQLPETTGDVMPLERLLVLDPQVRLNNTEIWNGVLEGGPNKGKRLFKYWTNYGSSADCTPSQCILFEPV